jgi:hypothetical protein
MSGPIKVGRVEFSNGELCYSKLPFDQTGALEIARLLDSEPQLPEGWAASTKPVSTE